MFFICGFSTLKLFELEFLLQREFQFTQVGPAQVYLLSQRCVYFLFSPFSVQFWLWMVFIFSSLVTECKNKMVSNAIYYQSELVLCEQQQHIFFFIIISSPDETMCSMDNASVDKFRSVNSSYERWVQTQFHTW